MIDYDKYDVKHFIEKFEQIPEELWCVGHYVEGDKRCALGHCGVSVEGVNNGEADSLEYIFDGNVADINDGILKYKYYGTTPKQRILAALMEKLNG